MHISLPIGPWSGDLALGVTLTENLRLVHKFQCIFLSNNVILSYNIVYVTVSVEMSDNALC